MTPLHHRGQAASVARFLALLDQRVPPIAPAAPVPRARWEASGGPGRQQTMFTAKGPCLPPVHLRGERPRRSGCSADGQHPTPEDLKTSETGRLNITWRRRPCPRPFARVSHCAYVLCVVVTAWGHAPPTWFRRAWVGVKRGSSVRFLCCSRSGVPHFMAGGQVDVGSELRRR